MFLEPLGITPYALAAALHVPRARIERLVREETSVSVDTALLDQGAHAIGWIRPSR